MSAYVSPGGSASGGLLPPCPWCPARPWCFAISGVGWFGSLRALCLNFNRIHYHYAFVVAAQCESVSSSITLLMSCSLRPPASPSRSFVLSSCSLCSLVFSCSSLTRNISYIVICFELGLIRIPAMIVEIFNIKQSMSRWV